MGVGGVSYRCSRTHSWYYSISVSEIVNKQLISSWVLGWQLGAPLHYCYCIWVLFITTIFLTCQFLTSQRFCRRGTSNTALHRKLWLHRSLLIHGLFARKLLVHVSAECSVAVWLVWRHSRSSNFQIWISQCNSQPFSVSHHLSAEVCTSAHISALDHF